VDGFSYFMRDLLQQGLPDAGFVGVEPHLRALRQSKLPTEIAAIRTAVYIGEAALSAAIAVLQPGVTGRELQAAYMNRMCEAGTSQFAQQGTFAPLDPGDSMAWMTSDRPLADGSLVVLAGGALWAGYEGSLARTWLCGDHDPPTGQRSLYRRWRNAIDAMLARCVPGATGADLTQAHIEAGQRLPPMTIAYRVGLGHEGPIAGTTLGSQFESSQTLHDGMVVALRSMVSDATGSFFGEEMVIVRDAGPDVLTRLSHGPLAR
jgi:Xaa-Pro aminopeptidase